VILIFLTARFSPKQHWENQSQNFRTFPIYWEKKKKKFSITSCRKNFKTLYQRTFQRILSLFKKNWHGGWLYGSAKLQK
jgi:hypothetical protein